MDLTEAQNLFALFFAIYFALIIDRANEMYKPWDTYNAWRRKPHNIRRLLAGWIILFIIPLLHFSIFFTLLGSLNIRFDATVRGILNIVLVGLGSFFDFGYFRIYEAFLHTYPGSFFSNEELTQIIPSEKIRPDFWAHFIPGALYVTLSIIMILISILLST
jgi:hypothetical protein